MKVLKNDCTVYVEQILETISNCYSAATPNTTQLMEPYSFIGKSICQQGEKAFGGIWLRLLVRNLFTGQ